MSTHDNPPPQDWSALDEYPEFKKYFLEMIVRLIMDKVYGIAFMESYGTSEDQDSKEGIIDQVNFLKQELLACTSLDQLEQKAKELNVGLTSHEIGEAKKNAIINMPDHTQEDEAGQEENGDEEAN